MKRVEPPAPWGHDKIGHPLWKSVRPLCNMLSKDSERPLLGIQGTEQKVNVHNRNTLVW